ncbi:MAG: hypothetical protein K0R41_354 [Geminicoccaceae bacterium]|jgi:uncharacterized protein (TIGR04255 family)|nr:hypothetical protein [Microvirga sp.]MCE3246529.1 hypothetical protein [Geminicoccaceae bacterium]
MTKARASNGELADYDRPPVIEVVYGAKFVPLNAWKVPHVGLFWKRIIDEFPRCEQAFPIPGTEFLDPSTGLPLPRVWLINAADDHLVQLQAGRFLFNWRRRAGTTPYPRYKILSDRFFGLYHEFQRFVAENRLGEIEFSEYELTYINHVFEQEGWMFPDHIGRVMEHLSWDKGRYRFLRQPSAINWQARFDFPEGPGVLQVKFSPARHAQEGKDLLVLELSARGLPAESPLNNMKAWFAHAHRWIVRGFEDLTSEEAQKMLWGKHERR